jgi:hypothetical protein
METQKIDKLISGELSKLEEAPPSASIRARAFIAEKRALPAGDDIFALLAAFLNVRIRLYHAVIASLILWAGFLYFSDDDQPDQNSSIYREPSHNIAAVNNSTLLSSCQTFVLRK